jgi:hypothetical protein
MTESVWLEMKFVRRKWWFGYRKEYYVRTEFGSLPCRDLADALDNMRLMRGYPDNVSTEHA